MSSPMQDQLQAALAELGEQRSRIREFQDGMLERRTSHTSKNRTVSATVDSGGRLVELSLRGNRWRSQSPAELTALIVETVSTAQRRAADEAAELALGLMPAGLAEILDGPVDFEGMVERALRLADLPVLESDRPTPEEDRDA